MKKKVDILESYLVDAVASMKSDLLHPGLLFFSVKLSGFHEKDKEVKMSFFKWNWIYEYIYKICLKNLR